MQTEGMALPPVIVNDRGEDANLDHARVTAEVEGVEAEDLLGQCIGCGGREDFLTLVETMRTAEQELLIVEPTGLFTLSELEKISDELDGCRAASVHLIPVNKIAAAVAVGVENMNLCQVIGLTHARGDVTTQVELIGAATGKPVVIVEEQARDEQIAAIWRFLMEDQAHHHEHRHGHGHGHEHGASCAHGCSHDHGEGDHHHHHEDEVISVTFSTEGWRIGEVLGFVMSVGHLLERFKGVMQADHGLVQFEWANGSWSRRAAPAGAVLKADLFTQEPVEVPQRTELTDRMIIDLVKGIPPVVVESPTSGYAKLDAVGPTAWELLYEQSKRASPGVREECGRTLITRCVYAAGYLLEDRPSQLDPKLVDYCRLQTAMVWLWWNQEFDFELEDDDRRRIDHLLQRLRPEQVDQAALEPWMGEAYGYLPRLMEQFPDHAATIGRVQARMSE